MSWNTRCAILFLLVVLGFSGAAWGATQNAVIYGTVYNAASNPMPDVTVVLENRALGFTRTTVTGSDGGYTFAEVPPADGYSVTAKQGTRTLDTRHGITVNVGDERVILPPLTETVQTATGQPGPKTPAAAKGPQQPTVRNEYPSTAASGVVTGDQLRSLPLYNRNFLVLGLLTPSSHDTEQGSALTGASFSVAGARPSQNSFLLDGSENLATSSNQAIPFQVNDSIQEFRVTSSSASAEYGRNLGGTVNVVTKRAGNAMHGSLYGYFANDALNADNPLSLFNGGTFDKAAAYAGPVGAAPIFNPGDFQFYTPFSYNQYVANAAARGFCTDSINTGAPGSVACGANTGLNTPFDPNRILATNDQRKQPLSTQQFGGSVGGALIKDKWFAFGSYEGTRIDNPNVVMERVPSAFDKTYAPLAIAPNFLPTNPNYVLDQNILGLFPNSNINSLTSGAVPGVLEFFQGEAPNYTHVHNFLFRSDFVATSKSTYSFRYVAQFLSQLHDDTLPPSSAYPGNGALRDAVNQNASLSFSHSFSSNLINELRLSYDRFDLGESAQDAGFDARTLGLPNAAMPTILLNGLDTQSSGAAPGVIGAFAPWTDSFNPGVMFPWADGRFPMARLGAPLGTPSERRDSVYSLADSVSWTHGRHSIKFGGDYRHLGNNLFNGALNRGLIYSGNIGQFTSDSGTCNFGHPAVGGLPLLACPGNAFNAPGFDFAQTDPAYSGKFSSYALSGYVQDNFKLRKNITFNFGVRYEFFSVPHEVNNNAWNFDPTANGLVQQNGTAILDPFGNTCGAANPASGIPTGAVNAVLGPFFATNWQTGNGCSAATSGDYNQLAQTNHYNFSPRFGFAWNVRGDEVAHPTVLRVGVGLFYDQQPINNYSQLIYNQPLTSPNGVLGQVYSGFDPQPLNPSGTNFCAGNAPQCSAGSTIILPAVQAATSVDGVNPNSFFTSVTSPNAVYALDSRNSATPRSWQVTGSLQQQITPKMTAEVGYVGAFSHALPTIYDQNYGNEWGHVTRACTPGPCDNPASNVFFDNLSQVPIYTLTNRAWSNYNSLMARVRIAGWHGLRLNGAYSYSKSLDNSSTGLYPTLPITPRTLLLTEGFFATGNYPALVQLLNYFQFFPVDPIAGTLASVVAPVFPNIDFSTGALTTTGAGKTLVTPYLIPQDPFNFLANDYGRSDFDSRHRLTIDYVWETKSSNKFLDMWTFSGIFTAQSGQPFSVFAGPIAGAITQRVELGVPQSQLTVTSNPYGAIDPTQYIFLLNGVCPSTVAGNQANETSTFLPQPGVACTGRSGRNFLTGPNLINMNFAIQKGFNIAGEDKKLYIRAEVFNLFNRDNFYNPISSASDNGIAPAGDFGQIKSAHDPRQVQLAVRFSW